MQQHWRKSTSRTLRRVETHVINKHTASVLRCRGQTSWRSEEENGRHKGRQHRKGNNLIQPSTKLMAKHKKMYKTISSEMSRILTHTQVRVGNILQIHLTTMSSRTFKSSFVFALRAERNIKFELKLKVCFLLCQRRELSTAFPAPFFWWIWLCCWLLFCTFELPHCDVFLCLSSCRMCLCSSFWGWWTDECFTLHSPSGFYYCFMVSVCCEMSGVCIYPW